MTVQDFLVALRQRWRIVLATLLLVLGVAALVSMQTPRVYEASSRVYLLAGGEDSNGNLYNMPATEKETLVQVASAPVVLTAVREQLGLPEGTPMKVQASTVGDTNLLDVTVRTDGAERAQQIATAVPEVLASVARDYAPSLSQSGQTVTASVLQPATVPGAPVEPDIVRNLLMGALAGLLLGIVFALVRHNMDTRIRGARDLATLSDRPLLSAIPAVDDDKGTGHAIYVESDPFGPQSEAVRQLRTNMLFVDVTAGGHAFMLTSSVPGEGKSTTAVNLGLAMADAGMRVLLIDADLRHPTIAKTLGLEDGVGLTTVLVGAAEPEDVIQRWAGTDLHILAAGDIPPNPSELLGSNAMKELFEELSSHFDFVLVDTPPVLPVADALVVSRLTSGTIMVVAADTTRKRHLAEALRVLRTADVEVGGFVLTNAPVPPTTYYSYYGGGDRGSNEIDPTRRGRGRSRSNTRVRAQRTQRVEQQFPHASRAAEQRRQTAQTRAAWRPADRGPAQEELPEEDRTEALPPLR